MSNLITLEYSDQVPLIDEVELDRFISRQATGGIRGQTNVISGGNAIEQREADIKFSRRLWNCYWISYSSDPQFRNLVAFFEARKWRGYGFRLFDWSDYQDDGMGVIEWNLKLNAYQLIKIYNDDIRPVHKPIYKPIAGTIKVFANGVQVQAPPLNYNAGIFGWTQQNKPQGNLTWRGEFNIPARFDTDSFSYKITPDDVVIWNGVDIIELT